MNFLILILSFCGDINTSEPWLSSESCRSPCLLCSEVWHFNFSVFPRTDIILLLILKFVFNLIFFPFLYLTPRMPRCLQNIQFFVSSNALHFSSSGFYFSVYYIVVTFVSFSVVILISCFKFLSVSISSLLTKSAASRTFLKHYNLEQIIFLPLVCSSLPLPPPFPPLPPLPLLYSILYTIFFLDKFYTYLFLRHGFIT